MIKFIQNIIFILESLTHKRDKAVLICLENEIPLNEERIKEIMSIMSKSDFHYKLKKITRSIKESY